LEGGFLRANYVLVKNVPKDAIVTDRILRRFPQLSTNEMPLYRQVFSNEQWRVFERIERKEADQ
jgi:hypothetical protein